MAAITWADYKEIRDQFYRQGHGKEEVKALATVPNTDNILACIQACEDWFTTGFTGTPTTSLKSAVETGLGQTMTNTLIQLIVAAWFQWKRKKLLGG